MKGPSMASAMSSQSRIFFMASLMAFSLFGFDTLRAQEASPLPDYVIEQFGKPPAIPEGPLPEALQTAVQVAFVETMERSAWGSDQTTALNEIAESKDPRLAWIVSDLMRFAPDQQLNAELANSASKLLGIELQANNQWGIITDHLIAWDIPAPPDYLQAKRAIFTGVIPGWDKIFIEGEIDWRHVSWGGVLIDDRQYDTTDELCNCIPAADNPEVSSAEEATWLDDADIVFGIEVNGEYRAYPRQIWKFARWSTIHWAEDISEFHTARYAVQRRLITPISCLRELTGQYCAHQDC